MRGGLKRQLNLLAVGVILAVSLFISLAAVVAMDRLTSQLSAARMLSELGWIRSEVVETHRILKDTGVDTLKTYLDSAQQETIQRFQDFRIGDTGRLYLVSADGRIVSASSDRQATDLDGPALELVLQEKVGHATLMIAGSPSIVYFDTFPEWGWRIVLVISANEINAARNNFILLAILILLFSACAGVVVFARVANGFVLPILELAEKLSGMKENQLGQHLEVKHRSKEVGILLSAFRNLSDRLLAAQNTLQEQNEELQVREEELQSQNDELISAAAMQRQSDQRHRSILQTAMDGIWLTDEQGRFVEVNGTYCRMSGYSMQELLTMSIADVECRETASDTAAHIKKIIELGEDRFESQHRRKDGSIYDVEVSVQYRPADSGQFVVFVQDITERKQAEHRLEKQKTQLMQRNKALRQFNYAVSHELKTPLVSIEFSLGLIQGTLPQSTDPELTTAFGYARHATRQMNNLLESLLLMFRIDAAENGTETTACGVLVQDAVDQLTRENRLKGIKVTISAEGPELSGDRHKLVQIWLHLIGNAAKYMGEQKHPTIDVGIEQTEQEVLFYVRDNGMGIEQAYQGKIFGLFDQLDKTAGGTGLGLTLVQRIVDYYGGTIRVESEGLSKGSCFYFTLPDVLINKGTTT